jgi:hypothetical protein
MLALTDHLGQHVFDRADARVGTVADLAARLGGHAPPVTRLLVRTGRRQTAAVPWGDVVDFERSGVTLRCGARELESDPGLGGDELRLMRDIVDTQIVDVSGRRVVRVADVELERRDGDLFVVGVDVGLASLVRRLGLRPLARRLRVRSVSWSQLYPASAGPPALSLPSRRPNPRADARR